MEDYKKYEVLNDYNLIEKSYSLILLDEYSNFGQAQYILLDLYLSLINSRDDSVTSVSFPKSDYEDYKNIKRIKTDALDKELQRLMIATKIPSDKNPDDPDSYVIKPLFKEARVEINPEDNRYWITLDCEPEMKQHFFNISKLGYIKYRLGMMKALPFHARLLYNHLHKNRNIKPCTISIGQLRKIMKCTTKNYNVNKEFLRVVRESIEEINNNTNLIISYDKVTNSKHEVIAISFVSNLDENKVNEDLAVLIATSLQIKYQDGEPIALAAQSNNLTDEEVIKRLEYIKTQKDGIKNIVGYSIKIMDNELWDKITKIEENNKKQSEANNDNEKQITKDDFM